MQYKNFKGYSVAIDGTVTNLRRGTTVKHQENNCGYMRVQMCGGESKPRFFVHRIVAELYIPNPLNLPQVNHKDGNKKNNHVSNLEWVTASQNHKHAFSELGKQPTRVCGDKSGAQKITLAQIEEARELVESGQLIKNVAKIYGIHRKYLGALLSGSAKRAEQ